jgi:hypothetical protein
MNNSEPDAGRPQKRRRVETGPRSKNGSPPVALYHWAWLTRCRVPDVHKQESQVRRAKPRVRAMSSPQVDLPMDACLTITGTETTWSWPHQRSLALCLGARKDTS